MASNLSIVGSRILYLRRLKMDRKQFWAMLLPFLPNQPTVDQTNAWLEHGELSPWLIKAEQRAEELLLLQEQSPYRGRL
jgi:hypothetical protein